MAKRTKSYGLNNPLQDTFPVPVVAQRAPTANDTIFEIGQLWVNKTSTQIYGLSSVVSGSAIWTLLGVGTSDLETLTGDTGGALSPTAANINILGGDGLTINGAGSTLTVNRDASGFPITPFVVGISGEAGYQTIQAGLDAANAAGGGLVFVQPGTYNENLTLYSNVDIDGGIFSGPTITGVHIPPTSGSVTFKNCTLTSPTSLFNSAIAGTTDITVETCVLSVANGYVYDLLNWTGNLLIDDCGSVSTNDGVINNTGGSFVKLTDATLGAGTGNIFTYSGGSLIMEGAVLQCPSTLGTGSTSAIRLGSVITATLTTTNDSIVSISNSTLSTGATPAISHGSTGTFSLSTSTLNSSNSPAIDGTGAGILTLSGVDFLNDFTLAGTLTITGGNTKSGTFETANTTTGLQIFSNSIIAEGTAANIPINISPKGIGDLLVNRNLLLPTAATQLQVQGGAATDFIGQATLVAGTVTVANTNIAATDKILVTREGVGASTALGVLDISITASTSFTITALQPGTPGSTQTGDVSIVNYFIVRQL